MRQSGEPQSVATRLRALAVSLSSVRKETREGGKANGKSKSVTK
jgi:hypothetical protein